MEIQISIAQLLPHQYSWSDFWSRFLHKHYNDVIMSAMASQITSLTIVYSTVYSGANQRKHQSSASLAFVRGIHRGPVNSPHKGPVARKIFPFDDIIMNIWYNGACPAVAIAVAITILPCELDYSVQLILRSGTRKWNLRVSHFKMRQPDTSPMQWLYLFFLAGHADDSQLRLLAAVS